MVKARNNTHTLTSTIIGKGSVLEGDFQVENDVTIYATLKGKLTCTGTVVVGESGYVEASVRAKDVIVNGKVVGDLEATNRVVLKSQAVLVGDLRTRLLAVEEGAVLQGRCNTGADVEVLETVEPGRGSYPAGGADEGGEELGGQGAEQEPDLPPRRGS